MEPTIKINCENCGKNFEKAAKEYRRQIKKGNTRFFCSRSCAALKNNQDFPRKRKINIQNLIPNNRLDEYSSFRKFISRSRSRDKAKQFGCDITVEYLKSLWEEQNGICPFTGWKLVLPINTDVGFEILDPANASLDRIDNSKGYVKDNVRFIAYIANIARQRFTDEQLIEFCKAVSSNNPT